MTRLESKTAEAQWTPGSAEYPSTNGRISPFIPQADIVSSMDLTREELEKTRKEIDLKLALSDEEFEKYASDLLERAVKGLRGRR